MKDEKNTCSCEFQLVAGLVNVKVVELLPDSRLSDYQ